MRLRRLELRNYRRFRRAEVEFPDGLVGVLGPNGVGKTTLVEAVAWALYGNEQTIVREGKEGVRSAAALGGEECSALLEFDLGADHYRLQRSLKGKDSRADALLTVNGSMVAKGDSAVTEAIQARLGMDHRAFFISVFARQKELNALSSLRPAERKKLILRMLDIDSLDDAITAVAADARTARDSADSIGKMVSGGEGDRREALRTKVAALLAEEEAHRKQDGELQGRLPLLHQASADALAAATKEEARYLRFTALAREAGEVQAELRPLVTSLETGAKELLALREAEKQLPTLEKRAIELEERQREKEALEAARSQLLQREQAEKVLEGREEERIVAEGDRDAASAALAQEEDEVLERVAQGPSPEALVEALDQATLNVARKEELLAELRREERALAEARAELTPLTKSIEADHAEVGRWQEEAKRLPLLEKAAEEYERLLQEKEVLESARLQAAERQQAEQEIIARERELDSLRKNAAERQQELKELPDNSHRLPSTEKSIADHGEKAGACKEARAGHLQHARELRLRIAADAEHLAALKGLGPESECPTCQRRLGDHQPHLVGKMEADLARMEVEAKAADEAAGAAGRQAESFLAMKQRSEERRTALLQEREQRAVLEEKVRTADEAAARAAKVVEAMRQRLSLLPGRPFDQERYAQVKEVIALRRTEQEALTRLRAHLARLPELEHRLQRAEQRWTELERRRAAAEVGAAARAGAEAEWREARHRAEQARVELDALRQQRLRDAERIRGLQEKKALAEETVLKAQKAASAARLRVEALPRPEFAPERLELVKAALPALKKEQEALTRLRADLARIPILEGKLAVEQTRRSQLEDNGTAVAVELAALQGAEATWRQARTAAEEARRRVELTVASIREAGQLAQGKAAQRQEVETQLRELDRLKLEEDACRARSEELVHLLEALKAFKADLTSRILPMLSETASQLLAELTGQRYARLQLDDDYEIHILDEGEEYPLARFSGGEADVASLCLRLAISRVIAERSGGGVNFLVLDEVFGSQDQERKRSILQLLEALRGQFPQILVITHIDDIKDMLGAVIAVSDDGHGGSNVKVT